MKAYTYFIIILCVLLSCNQKPKDKTDRFEISGRITGLPDSTQLYLTNLDTEAVFDSTMLSNGNFKFIGTFIDPPTLLRLQGNYNDELFYTSVLIGNESVTITGDRSDFPNSLKIKGSPTQNQEMELDNQLKSHRKRRDSIMNLVLKAHYAGDKEKANTINKQVTKIDSLTQTIKIDYIKTHPKAHTSVIQLNYLKNQISKEKVRKLYQNLDPEIQQGKYGRPVKIFLEEKILNAGDAYYDFEAYQPNDELTSLSDLRGKYTLVDFTTAYCGPCIQAVEELKDLNQHIDSLKIVSVSGDMNKEVWLNSLERDQITWKSVWDGKGSKGKTFIKYGAARFPTFVLIDPKGKLVKKWSGYGKKSLINKFSEMGFKNLNSL